MTREEVLIQMGIDNSNIAKGMMELNQKVKHGTEMTVGEIKKIGKEFQDAGKFIKGFGIVGFINQVVSMLTPATIAVSTFFGKFFSGASTGEARLKSMAKGFDQVVAQMKKARKEAEELKKTLAVQSEKTDDARRDANQVGETPVEKEARLRKEMRDAEIEFRNSQNPLEKLKEEESFLKKKKEYDEHILSISKETAREAEKKNKADKEAQEKKVEGEAKILKLKQAQGKTEDDLRVAAGQEYMPTIDDLANNPNSPVNFEAKRVKFLEKDTKMAYQLGNTNYAEGNIKEIDRLKKFMADKGFIKGDDLSKKIADNAEKTALAIQEIKDNGVKVYEEE